LNNTGAGNVTVTSASTFSSAISHAGTGTMTINGDVTMTNGSNITSSSTGALSINGNVTSNIIAGGNLDANITRVLKNSTGNVTVTGTINLRVPAAQAAQDFTAIPVLLSAGASGTLSVGTLQFSAIATPTAASIQQVLASNSNTGVLTIGSVTAANIGSGGNIQQYQVNVVNGTTGTVNLGAGQIFALTNSAATGKVNLTGSVTATGVVTNVGTGAGNGIILGENNLTLNGAMSHATNGGVISGAGSVILAGNGAKTFDGGTFPNVSITGTGATTFNTNAITVTGNFTQSANNNNTFSTALTLQGSFSQTNTNSTTTFGAASTVAGTFSFNGNITQNNSLSVTGNFTQSGGAYTLAAAQTLTLIGNTERSLGTFTAGAGSTVAIAGTAAQTFDGGPNLQVANLTFNNPNQTITMNRSIRADGNVNMTAGTNVNFQGWNLVLNGDAGTFTFNGTYTADENGGVYVGGVNAAGAIIVQGGIALPGGYTLTGNGTFGNLFISSGAANAVNVATAMKFNQNLHLLSGVFNVANGADFSPTGTNPTAIFYPDGVNTDVTLTGTGTFNNDGNPYDLKFSGTLTANRNFIATLYTAQVRDIIFATSGAFDMNLGDVNYTVNRDLVVEAGSRVGSLALTANRTVTVGRNLLVRGADGRITDGGNTATAFVRTFILNGNDASHVVTGRIEDDNANSNLAITVNGNNATLTGGTFLANNRILDAVLTVNGQNFAINDIQEVQQAVTVAANAGLTLNLSNRNVPAAPAAPTRGIVDAAITNNGALTVSREIDLTGTLTTGAASSTTLNARLYANNASALVGNATATYASGNANGILMLNNVSTVSAAGASIPRVTTVGSAVTLTSSLVVSEDLVVGSGNLTVNNTFQLTVNGNMTMTGSINQQSATSLPVVIGGNSDRTITVSNNSLSIYRLIVNTDNTKTIASNNADVRTLTTGTYVHTNGTLALGANILQLQDNATLTAGSITNTTGRVQYNGGAGASAITTTNAFSIGRLTVTNANAATLTMAGPLTVANLTKAGAQSLTLSGAQALTVTGTLILEQGALNNNVAGSLVVGNGASITRGVAGNAGTVTSQPTWGGVVDITYNGNNAITTGAEQPSTAGVLRNLTVNLGAATTVTTLGSNVFATNAVTLSSRVSIPSASAFNFNVADDATVTVTTAMTGVAATDRIVAGKSFVADKYTVTYRASNTTSGELSGNNASIVVNDQTSAQITLTLSRNYDLAKISLGENDRISLNDLTITVADQAVDLSSYKEGSIVGPGTIKLDATTAQTITVATGGLILAANVGLVVDNSNGVTLSGGNLTLQGNLELRQGVFTTGDNVLQLTHTSTTNQGFSRPGNNPGFVVGNVRKLLPSAGNASNTVIFPVGGLDTNSPVTPAYAPFEVTFNNPSLIPGSVFMTVNHKTTNPQSIVGVLGANGWPIANGVRQGESLARYPDTFYWLVSTSNPLPQNLEYEIIAERQNFNNYVYEGVTEVSDIRIVNRSASSINNPWLLVGDAGNYLQSEQIGTIPNVHPRVAAASVTGVLRAGAGTIFTYGLKSDLEFNTVANVVLNAGQTKAVYIADKLKGGTRPYSFNSNATSSTVRFQVTGDSLFVTGQGVTAGESITVTVTDALSDTRSTSLNVTVNPALAFKQNALSDIVLNVGNQVSLDLSTLIENGSAPYTYNATTSDAAILGVARVGSVVTHTAVAAGTAQVTFTISDATGAQVVGSFNVKVNAALAVSATPLSDLTGASSLRANDQLKQAAQSVTIALSGAFDGGTTFTGAVPYTYSTPVVTGTAVSAAVNGDNLVVTALLGALSFNTSTVSVTATDSLGASLTQSFDVAVVPAFGDINADKEVDFRDAIGILRYVVGLTTPPAAQLANFVQIADVDNNSTVNSFDAAVVLQYGVEIRAFLPVVAPPGASKVEAGWGSLTWGEYSVSREESTVTIPLVVNSDNGLVYSLDFSAEFDVNQVAFESIAFNNLPEGWITIANTEEDGKISIALAGSTPINGGDVASVTFSLLNEGSVLSLSGEGFVNSTSFYMERIEVEQLPALVVDNSNGVTLSGGNLTLQGNLELRQGVFTTGDNVLQLTHTSTTNQGFSRPGNNPGFVVGNVRKLLPSAGNASNTVIFPVGGLDTNSPVTPAYAPFEVTFNNPSLIPGSVFMTVNHKTTNPQSIVGVLGANGWPIANGVRQGESLARYPDTFYWLVSTSNPLPQNLEYEIIAERQNFNNYVYEGVTEVSDIRIVNRSASSINNPWLLVGDAGNYLQSEQIGTIPNVHPRVAAASVTGVLRAGAGTIFTYGLKSDLEFNTVANVVLNAGQTKAVYIADKLKGGTRPYSFNSNATSSTVRFQVTGDSLFVTGQGVTAGESITVTVTDALSDTRSTSLNVTVNPALAFKQNALSDIVLNVGNQVSLDLSTLIENGSAPYTYNATTSDAAILGVARVGSVVTHTAVAAGTAQVTFTISDATGAQVVGSFNVKVNAALAVSATPLSDLTGASSLRANDQLKQAAQSVTIALSGAFDGGTTFTGAVPYTYSTPVVTGTAVSAAVNGDNLVVTALLGALSFNTSTVSVTATDSLGASLTQSFDVAVVPAFGDINADKEVDFRDAIGILRYVVGLTTPPAAQLANFVQIADVDNNSTVNSFDAAVVLQYGVEIRAFLPVVAPPGASKVEAGWGSLTWGEYSVSREESTVTIPLVVNSDNGLVYSLDFSAEFDVNQVAFESIAFNNLPEGWITIANTEEDGKISIALAGSTPINGGDVASVTFSLLNEGSVLSLSGEGFVNSTSFYMERIEVEQLPAEFALGQNFPNPFNPTTNIRYALPIDADVTISVYNTIGQKVLTLVNGSVKAGTHTVTADFSRISSGVYMYRIEARSENETFIETRKMTLIK
jgi:hypothetical protein